MFLQEHIYKFVMVFLWEHSYVLYCKYISVNYNVIPLDRITYELPKCRQFFLESPLEVYRFETDGSAGRFPAAGRTRASDPHNLRERFSAASSDQAPQGFR